MIGRHTRQMLGLRLIPVSFSRLHQMKVLSLTLTLAVKLANEITLQALISTWLMLSATLLSTQQRLLNSNTISIPFIG